MAGIWNRIVERGENAAPISSDLCQSLVYLVTRGILTAQQARDALNAFLPPTKPLTTAEATDLNNMVTAASGGSATAKLDYQLRLRAVLITAEVGMLTNEATFRSELGLP